MFQFPACPLPGLYIQPGVPGHYSRRVAPFGNPRIKRSLAAPRGLSQQRYVLHRLLVPRHPPCALSSLTFLSSLFNDCLLEGCGRGQKATPREVSLGVLKKLRVPRSATSAGVDTDYSHADIFI